MTGLLGSLLGFGTSIIPAIIDGFKRKQDHKHELEKMKIHAELQQKGFEFKAEMYREMGADLEHQRLIDHDIAISKHRGWIGALQRSVRPVITYAFFLLFAVIEINLLIEALNNDVLISDALHILWDEDTKAIWAAIISFWFGSRAIDKTRNTRTIS